MKKKILALMLCILLAATPAAAAVSVSAVSVTLTPIDYLYAQAGIAQPVNKTYVVNERYAVLVTVTVPNYMDVNGMETRVQPFGCTHETGAVPVASGQYIITGTVLSAGASLKVVLQDQRIGAAGTAQELWQALYSDRTVEAVLNFGLSGAVSTIPGAAIPQTGVESVAPALMCGAGVLGLIVFKKRRK